MKNSAAKDNDRAVHKGTSMEELHSKILGFLAGEFARKEGRQCTSVELLYTPGSDFRDEEIRQWIREEDSELFESFVHTEKLVSMIIEIAENAANTKPAGKHRFVVRTYQHLGGRAHHPFALSPSYNGGVPDPDPDVDRKNDGLHEPRKRLLARVAGNIAAGIISDPSEATVSAEGIAGIAVDVAEAILKKIGL
jgi:hypothetical protein